MKKYISRHASQQASRRSPWMVQA